MRISQVGLALSLWLLGSSGARADATLLRQLTHHGMCEASAAVAVPAGSFGEAFAVANDEDNVLRLYAADRDGEPLPATNAKLDPYLGLDAAHHDNDKADLEAAAWLGDRIYWLGSHSRSAKGKLRLQRQQLFATTLGRAADGLTDFVVTGPHAFTGLLKALVGITDPDLAAATRLDVDQDEELAAEAAGLNIEGLAAGPDGQSLLIGFRNPLSADGRALVLPLRNPAAVVDQGAAPAIGAPILLDLHRRGIRSLDADPAGHGYDIVAGPTGSSEPFDLYRWSGNPADRPHPVLGAAALFATIPDFHPEALLADPAGSRLLILSDDGDRMVPAAKSECRDGFAHGHCPCKELTNPDEQRFRSALIVVE